MIRRIGLVCIVLSSICLRQIVAQELRCVATEIEVHPNKRITAGDDIVVFGHGGFSGVDYIVPSQGDTKGRGIPGGEGFHSASFAVAGKRIALVKGFAVTIYDTVSGNSTEIPVDNLRLTTVPSRLDEPGHMDSDGSWIVCRSDKSTTDQRFIKAIDLRGINPKLVSFKHNPPVRQARLVIHVLVDATTERVVAATHEAFYVYDINQPEERPVEIKVAGEIGDVPPQLDGHHLLFQDRSANPNAIILDLPNQKFVTMPLNPSSGSLKLGGESFAFFVNASSEDTVGNGIRCVYGKLSQIESYQVEPQRKFINGRTSDHGAFGYGETLAITSDGQTCFLAGRGSIGSGEYLQVNRGDGFQLVPDPLDQDELGCYAADISLFNETLAFKTKGKDHRASYVGYAIIQ